MLRHTFSPEQWLEKQYSVRVIAVISFSVNSHLSNVDATEWNCSAVDWDEERARRPAAWGEGVRLCPFLRLLVGAGGAGSGLFWML